MHPFAIRGFNPCESLLRHTPDQLRTFIRRMKVLRMNTLIVHYDYGWKRYQKLILEECENAEVNIILMTFGPRTFFSYSNWKNEWFAKKSDGTPFTEHLECETHPCRFVPEALEAYAFGARQWLKSLPPQIRHVHMRAADGGMFCQCEKCRILPEHERWQPFVERFVKAVTETRPELRFETDIYYKRYNIPANHAPFATMSNIMFDTFPRLPANPLGSTDDTVTTLDMSDFTATGTVPDAPTANSYLLNRLREWNSTFPGKVYIHENAMGQGFSGLFQYGTGAYLQDMKTFRELEISGICYEAYEPGYGAFALMFELLAAAMNGEEVEYESSELEKSIQRNGKIHLFCDDPDFPLEKYLTDSFMLKHAKLVQRMWANPDVRLFRDYLSFELEHQECLDPINVGFALQRWGRYKKTLAFRNISPEAEDFISRRKLWDFMEAVPLSQDPREVCLKILAELMGKAV